MNHYYYIKFIFNFACKCNNYNAMYCTTFLFGVLLKYHYCLIICLAKCGWVLSDRIKLSSACLAYL